MMTDKELISRIETLELRFLDQERTLDELTETMLKQERQIKIQGELIKRLEEQLKILSATSGSGADSMSDETPPHY